MTTGTVTASNGFGVAAQSLGTTGTGSVVIRSGAVTATNGNAIFATVQNATGSVDIGGCPTVTNTSTANSAIFANTNGTGNVTINCGAVTSIGDRSGAIHPELAPGEATCPGG